MIYDVNGHTPKIDPNSWVASNAVIIGRVELKKNSNIWFNTTLRGDLEPIIIGENSNVQDGSVIHTDPGCPTIVGKGVTIGHMVMLHGCEIADDCLIGIGSTILNKTKNIHNGIISILDNTISMYNNLSYEIVSAKNSGRKLSYK